MPGRLSIQGESKLHGNISRADSRSKNIVYNTSFSVCRPFCVFIKIIISLDVDKILSEYLVM